MPYQSLNADKLHSTVARLQRRIEERSPGPGLAAACGELVGLAEKARDATDRLTRPMLALRLASGALISPGGGLVAEG